MVIYNGIDFDVFNTSSQTAADEGFVILSVGSLTPQKNYKLAIDVIHEILNRGYSNIEYLIAGSGRLEVELASRIAEDGLTDVVKLLGTVNDVPSLLRTADIFFMPSSWEGFGIAALEAMACGIPVIASDLPGIREVVGSDDSCGILTNPYSANDMADVLEDLLTDRRLMIEMGKSGAERARRFDIERTVDEHISLYKKIMLEGENYEHQNK